jgi:hypothetical protein
MAFHRVKIGRMDGLHVLPERTTLFRERCAEIILAIMALLFFVEQEYWQRSIVRKHLAQSRIVQLNILGPVNFMWRLEALLCQFH